MHSPNRFHACATRLCLAALLTAAVGTDAAGQSNAVSGVAFIDENGNGIRDPGE